MGREKMSAHSKNTVAPFTVILPVKLKQRQVAQDFGYYEGLRGFVIGEKLFGVMINIWKTV